VAKGNERKIFRDANLVNLNYRPFDASGWSPLPSGLKGSVRLAPMR